MSTTLTNPFAARPNRTRVGEAAVRWVLRLCAYLVLGCGAAVLANIVWKGAGTVFQTEPPFVNVRFFTQAPESLYVFDYEGRHYELGDREYRAFRAERGNPTIAAESYVYSAGGIFPAIAGTVLLVVGSMTIALALGVCAAIYLNEYARDSRRIRFVRLAIVNLAGVPSIVFGLFGFGLFVIFLGWNVSLLAGWFTLAFMVLPVVITASEESLKAVPKGFREGALALGATKWQTIRKNVLPYALPGILTSSILGIARVAGETAPIMFTAAYVIRDKLPWDVEHAADFVFQGVMALPYHIYVVSSKIPQNAYTERVQYGTALVFLLVVAATAAAAIVLRNRLRHRYRW
ncbi:phosphate ABC transporter permease PstA [Opitutus terrae]|uniref:Phosphate transport system permease protein PstA n=1 Tax=Opitutus terrae (strain DSM 11246 / JCM 15787 / PB90-1) TaxID=452637 RepID=B1ZT40_OPITP|nr:phosphate ABC transporter permease PstA [Opitutus terrae]ACB75829.1 phosphate ABC transporter, inner membrane subunit PstA [Opitutus terrae PB90-1]